MPPYRGRYLEAAVEELRALPSEECERDVLSGDVTRALPLKRADPDVLGRHSSAGVPRLLAPCARCARLA
ncbi:hypothetical protein [Streptomyces sp. AA1529]|uniref:hypothetical protein n=1 Tax=Streptomyces sp. AA1529 TaxID=1203257 RepID=UPI003D75E120